MDILYYYDHGQGNGVLLVKSEPCLKIDKSKGPGRNLCLEPVADKVKKGTLVYASMLFMIPRNTQVKDVYVQFIHEGRVRTTKDIHLGPSFRYPTYRADTLSKSGTWEIKVMHGDKILQAHQIIVD